MFNSELCTPGDLSQAYASIRARSGKLCEPLEIEDHCVQPVPEVSPPKWHLAHTTWFFETFLLRPFDRTYRVFDKSYNFLFNSYYNSVGPLFPREERGTLARPLLRDIHAYRECVDAAMMSMLERDQSMDFQQRVRLGLSHEQQHQELLVTDLKYILGKNPLHPSYHTTSNRRINQTSRKLTFSQLGGGLTPLGADAIGSNFLFDNETPRHSVYLEPYQLADRLVTNGEYLEFVRDGGYDEPRLWLSDGWTHRNDLGWEAPEYWIAEEGDWFEYTLDGVSDLDLATPVTHVSLYEADAFARWCGARLATEAEWEHAATQHGALDPPTNGTDESFHPQAATNGDPLAQMIGDCWEWTSSSYSPYPGYKPLMGALGEYNGKFMANQFVLRGGSCATPLGHIRTTYRNFFYAKDRWQFMGIRLAKNEH